MNIYKVESQVESTSELPHFEIRDFKIYRTSSHPEGLSGHHLFEIKGNKIYPSEFEVEDVSDSYHFEIKDYKLYRTDFHPDGLSESPDFEIR